MYTSMFRKAMLGDTATLSLDFTAGTVPTAVTFTRADSTARATFIDASGYVKTVAAAGAARFDYTGGVAKGLLIEAAATNLALRSSDFNTTVTDGTSWTASGYTRSNVSTLLPDGTTGNACQISGSSSASFRNNAATVVASTVYTWSFYARNNGGSQARYRVWNASAGSSIVDYTLAGSNYVSQIGGANNTSSTWVRVSVTFTTPVSCTSIFVYPLSSDSGTVDVLIWGAQLELGAQATSYISNAGSQLTRLADDAVIRSTAWTGLYSKPGTIVVEYYRGEYGAGDRSVLAIDTAATKHIHLKHANASAASGIYNSAGSGVANKLAGNASGLNKAAFNWDSANPSTIKYALNGNATVVSGSSDIGATLGTWMTIGSASTTGVSGSGTWEGYLNNSIKSVKYYSELLSDADMIAKTT